MEIKVTKELGNNKIEFNINAKDAKTALSEMTFYTAQDNCYLDGFQGKPVVWETRKAKGKEGTPNAGQTFTYIQRRCYGEGGKIATSQMGEYQDGGFYWKKWEVYNPESKDDPAF